MAEKENDWYMTNYWTYYNEIVIHVAGMISDNNADIIPLSRLWWVFSKGILN